jgi:hypothetical protein
MDLKIHVRHVVVLFLIEDSFVAAMLSLKRILKN